MKTSGGCDKKFFNTCFRRCWKVLKQPFAFGIRWDGGGEGLRGSFPLPSFLAAFPITLENIKQNGGLVC